MDRGLGQVGFSPARFLAGIVSSALVMWLFLNLQTISDMAPAFIKESSMPGAMGAPIAILTLGWMIFVTQAFVRAIRRGARNGSRFTVPGPFVLGAFVSLAAILLVLRYLGISSLS